MIGIYHGGVLAVLTVMAVILTANLLGFGTVRRRLRPSAFPRVAVLIPARNEERQLGECLASVAAQDYPDLEVLVLDDGSTDGTATIARSQAQADPRFRLLQGAPLPAGWAGKTHACHQLAQAARADLLLFLDADTILAPEAVRAAVTELETRRADLLSLIPFQVMGSFWERVIVPMLHFSAFCFLPFPLVPRTRSPKLAMANGQFMLFRRAVYEKIGGHAAVRSALVEDVWLARLVKQHGYRLEVTDGREVVSCRMYRSLGEIWEGFSKNLFAGFSYSLPRISSVMLMLVSVSVGPFLVLPFVRGGPWEWAVMVQVAMVLGMRLALALRFRMNPLFSLLHPLATVVVAAIAANSVRMERGRGGVVWKGRKYKFSV